MLIITLLQAKFPVVSLRTENMFQKIKHIFTRWRLWPSPSNSTLYALVKLVELFSVFMYTQFAYVMPLSWKNYFLKSNEFSQNNQYGNTLVRVPLGNLIYNIGRGFHAKYFTLSFVCLSVVTQFWEEKSYTSSAFSR